MGPSGHLLGSIRVQFGPSGLIMGLFGLLLGSSTVHMGPSGLLIRPRDCYWVLVDS